MKMQNVNIKNVAFQKGKDINNQKTIEFILYVGRNQTRKTFTVFRSYFNENDSRELMFDLGNIFRNHFYNVNGSFYDLALFFSKFKFNFENYYI